MNYRPPIRLLGMLIAPATTDHSAGRGLSFGWSAYEGNARFNQDQIDDLHTDPFATYERADGQCSISGGAVYRGDSLPSLNGWFVYGDYCTGTIWALNTTASNADSEPVQVAQTTALVAIATGADGELYIASKGDTVSILEAN